MKRKKTMRLALLLLLCAALTACRARIRENGPAGPDYPEEGTGSLSAPYAAVMPDSDTGSDEPEKDGESGGPTRENPEASRKEYDETRPAEVVPGAERTVSGSGEGEGFSAAAEKADRSAAMLNEEAEKTATRTIAAQEAEQTGVSEDAEAADSAMTYYSVLLKDRTESLFECRRVNVYWETKEDYRTVYRTSAEHRLILDAGAGDVSARLPEESLQVDDGWIGRKNPGVIVKVVGRNVLGTGVPTTRTAERVYADLEERGGWRALDAVREKRMLLLSEEMLEAPHLQLAAMVLIAKTAYPDLFEDVDPDTMMAMLSEEAAGGMPSGVFYYCGQGE